MSQIVITTPKTDLCWTCQQNRKAISTATLDAEKMAVSIIQHNYVLTITMIGTSNCYKRATTGSKFYKDVVN